MYKTCTKCKQHKPIEQFPLCRGVPRPRCKPCHSADAMNWANKNPEKYKARLKQWHRINNKPQFMGPPLPAHIAAERRRQAKRKWQENNKEKNRASKKEWVIRNKDYHLEKTRSRQANKLNATPVWANRFFIREAYDLAARRESATGFKWHVDHIVPLKSKLVCGLHCEQNIRVIPASLNRSKSNRYWPDMP